MSSYREIVTKAVVGKGKKKDSQEFSFEVDKDLSKALGCWIINNEFSPVFKDEKTYIKGTYDINVWYAYDQDSQTDIYRVKQDYEEEIVLKMKEGETIKSESELKAFCLKYPTCTNLSIKEGNKLVLTVDKEFSLDVIGEAKLKIQVSKLDEDEWALDDQIDNAVNVDYISK